MVLVKPATVVQWHRKGFRLFWRWHSRSGRPSVDREVRDLIRQMSAANPLWGEPRIHGELLKLGIEITQATVAKYLVRRRGTLLELLVLWALGANGNRVDHEIDPLRRIEARFHAFESSRARPHETFIARHFG